MAEKEPTRRRARASGLIRMEPTTLAAICRGAAPKGNVCETARLAGIMAAKRTADLIPLCHPLALDCVSLDFTPQGEDSLLIESTVEITAKTGAEMEALAAVSVAALTVYDMCKSVDRAMVIQRIQLEEKSGGASGSFIRNRLEGPAPASCTTSIGTSAP